MFVGKRLSLFLLILLSATSKAATLEDLETITALARIPVVIGANIVDRDKTVIPKVMHIIVDTVRLSNEMVSIINKHGTYYDYAWCAYDLSDLYLHIKDLLKQNSEDIDGEDLEHADIEASEFKELSGMLQIMHERVLPLLEGVTACIAAANIGKSAKDEKFRLKCKSINSLVRLLDNLIISKPKSYEQYAFACLLFVNIALALHDWLGTGFTRECDICKEQREVFIRLACNQAVPHIFCRECMATWTGTCPNCRAQRVPDQEVELTEDQLKAIPV